VRAVSQRLEAIEEALARLEDSLRAAPSAVAARLDAIEERLADVTALLGKGPSPAGAVSPAQERLAVEEPQAPAATH
jgi:glutathione S-transferase